jgi:hypothetical protein
MSELRTASLGCRNESQETRVQTVCRVATRRQNIHCIACLLVAVCLCANTIRAQEQPKFSPVQQEVINAHEARTEASDKRNLAAYSRYVADDCIFSGDNGSVLTKAQLMASIGRKFPTEYDHSVILATTLSMCMAILRF